MKKKAEKQPARPKKVVVPPPMYSPKFLGIWVVAVPAALHLFLAFLLGLEADSSFVVLLGAIFAAVFAGLLLSALRYDPVTTAVGASWLPAFFTWRHWYWGLDMHSPGGASQDLVAALGWRSAHAAAAVGAVCAAFGVGAWSVARVSRWNTERSVKKRLQDGKPGHDARP